ncbi:MAG: response regulator [Bacteroidetes bacterium]|nr:response regulator [Bacteroidota bacterium]
MQTKPQRVLIVDDEESFADLIANELSTAFGYRAITAYGGSTAINLLKTEKFDVVLLDYRMPEVSGLNVLQWMHEQKMETPVIMFTAAGSEHVSVEAMKLGAYDYVRKEHVDIEHLPYLLNGVYERYLFRKEKERLEKEEAEFAQRAAAIEMFHNTVASIAHYVNNALVVLEMQTLNQEFALKNLAPPERREQVAQSFTAIRAEFRIISTGIKALTGFSDIIYSKPGTEKEMPKLQDELQKTLENIQKLSAII